MKSSKELSMVKKVAIIGPESTGKSTLSTALAWYYQSEWVPEYAREYLLSHGTAYTYESLLEIAKGQVALEDEYLGRAAKAQPSTIDDRLPPTKLWTPQDRPETIPTSFQRPDYNEANADLQPPTMLFIDTEMYVMKVWAEFVYGKCHQWIIDQIVERQYDLYLLCNIDLPWQPDILREYPAPEPRMQLFRMYHDILINQSTPWTVISGNYEERLQLAITATNRILQNK